MIVTLSALLILTALGVVYYWVDFYLRGAVNVITEDWYIKSLYVTSWSLSSTTQFENLFWTRVNSDEYYKSSQKA